MILTIALSSVFSAILLSSCFAGHLGSLPYTVERQSSRDRRLAALRQQVAGLVDAAAAQRAAQISVNLPRPAKIVRTLGSIYAAQQAAEQDIAVAKFSASQSASQLGTRNWLTRLDRHDCAELFA